MHCCRNCRDGSPKCAASIDGFHDFGAIDLPVIAQNINTPERLINRFTIESKYGPVFTVEKPFEGPSAIDPILRFAKPRFTIEVKGFDKPLVYQPYGSPDPQRWGLVKTGGLVAGGVLLFLAGYGALRLVRR